jgi:hypothetical protein
MDPDVYVSPIPVRLFKGHPPTVWRDRWIRKQSRGSDGAYLFPTPIKPNELGPVRAFASLHDQGLISGHTEKSQVGLREVLHLVADRARFATQRVSTRVKALRDQSVVTHIQEVAGIGIGRIRTCADDKPRLLRIQRAYKYRVFFEFSSKVRR